MMRSFHKPGIESDAQTVENAQLSYDSRRFVYYNKAMSEMGLQIISFIGALLILIAYAGHQMKLMNSGGAWYNVLNFLGSSLLGYVAFFPFKIGFVVLEIMWALISLWGLFRHTALKNT